MRNACQFRRGPKFGYRGNTHRKQHQRQQLSPQAIHPPEGGVQMAVAPGYSSQPVLQIQLCNQGQNQFQSAATTPTDFAAVNCWPMQNMQIQNTSSQSQTPANTTSHVLQHAMQGNEQYGYMQNGQEYNHLWQYYYYQQQQQLQLQQHYIQLQQQSFQQGQSQQQHSQLEPLQPQQLQQQVLQQQPLQQEHPVHLMQQQQPSTRVH